MHKAEQQPTRRGFTGFFETPAKSCRGNPLGPERGPKGDPLIAKGGPIAPVPSRSPDVAPRLPLPLCLLPLAPGLEPRRIIRGHCASPSRHWRDSQVLTFETGQEVGQEMSHNLS